jgi:hypothetical protein
VDPEQGKGVAQRIILRIILTIGLIRKPLILLTLSLHPVVQICPKIAPDRHKKLSGISVVRQQGILIMPMHSAIVSL